MTSWNSRFLPSWLIFVAVALVYTITAHAQDFASESLAVPAAAVTFNFVTTPDIGSVSALAASSEQNIWATSASNSLALHFDGSRWVKLPMAKAGRVNKAAVLSSVNVWSVGQQTNERFSQIQHFNGTAWSVVASPHFANGERLNSVKAVTANSIFAVGVSFDSLNNGTPLILHFNGTAWSVVSVPRITAGELTDITVISPTEMWAVGAVSGQTPGALTMHFNGVQWSRVSAPNGALLAVSGLAANNVWAAGMQLGRSTVIEHWDGTAWKIVASPNVGPSAVLNSISAISPTDIWVAGCSACGDVGGNAPALIEHWNGTTWSINPAPVALSGISANTILSFPSSKHIFIGGFAFAQFGPMSVILRGAEGLP